MSESVISMCSNINFNIKLTYDGQMNNHVICRGCFAPKDKFLRHSLLLSPKSSWLVHSFITVQEICKLMKYSKFSSFNRPKIGGHANFGKKLQQHKFFADFFVQQEFLMLLGHSESKNFL